MNNWITNEQCTACAACQNICPTNAIRLLEDKNGFAFPKIDTDKCIDCGQCEASCPVLRCLEGQALNIPMRSSTPQVFAAWSRDDNIRLESSSGGVFSELARTVLAQGGSIVGAVYSADQTVVHKIEFDESGLQKIRQSKYVQSQVGFVFQDIKNQLTQRPVLFCGASCQVAGLYSFLGQDFDHTNLYTVDFVCRGMNSPKAYRSWLHSLEEEYGSTVKRVWFRNKIEGWKHSSTRVEFADGAVYCKPQDADLYMRSFLGRNLFIRPSCTGCQFKGVPRMGDITLADFWQVDAAYDSDQGTSMVILNSDKGISLFQQSDKNIESYMCSLEDASAGNICLNESVKKGKYSDYFFSRLNENVDSSAIFNEITEKVIEDMPMLSIILVTDDKTIHLNETIRLIKKQSYKKIEVFILDLAKTEKNKMTHQVLRNAKFVVRYFHQQDGNRNRGLNQALKYIKGDYVHICDSQTYPLYSSSYEAILQVMEKKNADIVCCGYSNLETDTMSGFMPDDKAISVDTSDFLRKIFVDNKETEEFSFGCGLFNKIFRCYLSSGMEISNFSFKNELYDFSDYYFLFQIGASSQTSVFLSSPYFYRNNAINGSPFTLKEIIPERFFSNISHVLQDIKNTEPQLFQDIALACMRYEIKVAVLAHNQKLKTLETQFIKHITETYSGILEPETLLSYLLKESINSSASYIEDLRESRKLQRENVLLEKENNKLNFVKDRKLQRARWRQSAHNKGNKRRIVSV